MKQDGRGDVVRHVAHEYIRPRGKLAKRHLEHVGLGDEHVVAPGIARPQDLGERAVVFNGDEAARALHEDVGEGAASRADLQHGFAAGEMQRVGDASQDAPIGEEVLAQALARWRKAGAIAARRARVVRHALSS